MKMVFVVKKPVEFLKCNYDDAMDYTGYGKYNILMLISCCLLILAMYLDIFGLSVVLPATACDLSLSTAQQGLLSAMPLIGVMTSSYAWGLCADTKGRRWTLLVAMPVGSILNLATSLAPTFSWLAALKYLSASFTSSANAAAFVLMGESAPVRYRSRAMFLMASATMFVQLIACICAIPIFGLTFSLPISWLNLDFRPWRLLLLVISLPGILGTLMMVFLTESPKYLLSKGKIEDAMELLRTIYTWNTGLDKTSYPPQTVILEESTSKSGASQTLLQRIWNQTAPLFKPPLRKNSLKLYYILLCAYMTSTGFTMWIPTMTNAYFYGEDASGKAFCEVAAAAASSTTNSTSTDCDTVIQTSTLYAVMCYSGGGGVLTVLLSFLVPVAGKRGLTAMVLLTSVVCGILLMVVRLPLLSIALFSVFLYTSLVLGNINSFLLDLNPTHLRTLKSNKKLAWVFTFMFLVGFQNFLFKQIDRGMATCLSVVVARGFGFFSVQLIAALLADHCIPMFSGYIVLVLTGAITAVFLPPDKPRSETQKTSKATMDSIESVYDKTKF